MTPTPPYVGAIDQGTTGTRFVVFDVTGTPIGDGFVAHERSLTPPDRVEYDATEIWQCTRAAIQEGIDRAGVDHDELAAIGIANQRQTTVVWDENGIPIAPAQSWQDRRSSRMLAELDPDERSTIEERTGLVVDPYFAGPKLAWLLENETYRGRPLREAAAEGDVSFGTIDSWLVSRLTGEHRTDVTNASQSLLFDHRTLQWDETLLAMFDIPRSVLPAVTPSGDHTSYGTTTVGGLLDCSLPVTGVIGNQQAALVGQGQFEPGVTKVSYGSGNFVLHNIGSAPGECSSRVLTTIWYQNAGETPLYGLEGPIFSTGTTLEWLADLGLLDDHGRPVFTEKPTADAGQPVVVPSIGSHGAPDWQSVSGGSMAGLTRFTDAADIVRATVDGIGFATRAVLEAIESEAGVEIGDIAVDGGAIADDTFAARQAALLGRPLVRGAVSQVSALGATGVAGIAAGVWRDRDAFASVWEHDRTFEPAHDKTITENYRSWQQAARCNPSFPHVGDDQNRR